MLIKAQHMPNNLSDLYYIWRLKINRPFNSMQKKKNGSCLALIFPLKPKSCFCWDLV